MAHKLQSTAKLLSQIGKRKMERRDAGIGNGNEVEQEPQI